MRRAKRAIIAIIVACTLFLHANKAEETTPNDEETDASHSLVIADDSDIQAELFEAKRRARLQYLTEMKRKRDVVKAEIMPSRSDSPRRETIAYEATAYVALCDTGCTGITKTGVDVRTSVYYEGYRVIAVDTRQIPLGSIVRVSLGDGTTFKAIAIDTGGDIKEFRIDVLVASESEAWEFGRQTVGIELLRRGSD